MQYFDEPVGRVKIQTTSKNIQRYYTPKRLIRDLLSNDLKFSLAKVLNFTWPGGMRRVQISVTCTRFGRYLYSRKQSWIIKAIIIHQTHYEKSDWSRAFNQFTIACELDMINAISAADIAFIMSSSTSAWLLSSLETKWLNASLLCLSMNYVKNV